MVVRAGSTWQSPLGSGWHFVKTSEPAASPSCSPARRGPVLQRAPRRPAPCPSPGWRHPGHRRPEPHGRPHPIPVRSRAAPHGDPPHRARTEDGTLPALPRHRGQTRRPTGRSAHQGNEREGRRPRRVPRGPQPAPRLPCRSQRLPTAGPSSSCSSRSHTRSPASGLSRSEPRGSSGAAPLARPLRSRSPVDRPKGGPCHRSIRWPGRRGPPGRLAAK